MATTSHSNNVPRPDDVLREQIHAAFDHVSLSFSCSLESLLEQTRLNGIHDDDVRHILSLDEVAEASGVLCDMHLQCYRSNAGVLYVTRDTAACNDRVSTLEAIVECRRGACGD